MKLHVLVDSLEYARANSYIHQLLITLDRQCTVTYFTLAQILNSDRPTERPDRTLSILKLRTLDRELDRVASWLDNEPVYCYEQDVWESFKDDSPYKGAYHRIASKLNVKAFLNTSHWWSQFVKSKGLPSKFVQMWLLPEYCSETPTWNERKIDVGFCGQLHPYRKTFFDELLSLGVNVQIVPTTDYVGYLKSLSQMKIYVHCERAQWKVDGKLLDTPNAMWIKDIEACARGCYSVRDMETESEHYGMKHVPTMFGYDFDIGTVDAAMIIQYILENGSTLHNSDALTAVEYIRSAPGWNTLLAAMEE